MKYIIKIAFFTLVLCVCFISCKHAGDDRKENKAEEKKIELMEGFVLVPTSQIIEGINPQYKLAGESGAFKGAFVEGRRVKLSPYAISKYELTYSLWYKVRLWAEENGYTFANKGMAGGDEKNGGGEHPNYGNIGKEPSDADSMLPVSMVNWRDAIVWCNAYTHMLKNGEEECVYKSADGKVLKDATEKIEKKFTCDSAIADIEKTGFRLPTEAEWELAARYTKNDVYADKCGSFYLTRLDAASGGDRCTGYNFYELKEGETAEILRDKLLELAVFGQYWMKEDDMLDCPAPLKAHPVGSKKANFLGIYDMSGNIYEWCFDLLNDDVAKDDAKYTKDGVVCDPQGAKTGFVRCTRGGSWRSASFKLANGYRKGVADPPGKREDTLGFRLVYSVRK